MKSIFPIILIVVAVGLFFFEVKPIYSEVTGLRAEASEYDAALKMADELGTLRGELSKKLDSFSQADLDRLNHFLPQQLDTVRIILDVDGIGVRNGVKLTDIKVANSDPAKAADTSNKLPTKAGPTGYQTVDVSFTFTAPYGQGVAFLKDVEQSLRLLDTASVKIKPNLAKGTTIYDFDIDLHTYWINR